MVLVQCSECRHQVSDHASSCPKCGYPLASDRTTRTTAQPVSRTDPYVAHQSGRGFHITQIVLASITTLIVVAVPVITVYGEQLSWLQMFRSEANYYKGWTQWQLHFSSRYETPLEQQLPLLCAVAMLPSAIAWIVVSALSISSPRIMFHKRALGKKRIVYWSLLPAIIVFLILYYFQADTQGCLGGLLLLSMRSDFTPAWWAMYVAAIVGVCLHIVYLLRGEADCRFAKESTPSATVRQSVFAVVVEILSRVLDKPEEEFTEATRVSPIGREFEINDLREALESEFDLELTDAEVEKLGTVGEVVSFLQQKSTRTCR